MTPHLDRILHALTARKSGSQWIARCPAHDDHEPSLTITAQDGKILVHCHAGCPQADVIAALQSLNVWPSDNTGHEPDIEAIYPYTDDRGNLIYEVIRKQGKRFLQRRPDGSGGWIWNLSGVRRVLYRLPDIVRRSEEIVYIVEGEKDVHSLERLGLLATTNPGGAGKWRDEYSAVLAGRDCVVIADNDRPGLAHAASVARSLLRHGASVRIFRPDTPKLGGDITDWINAGGTLDELRRICAELPPVDDDAIARLASDQVQPLARPAHVDTLISDLQAPYPRAIGEEAYYGIAGRFTRLVEPHTEADPSFLLIQFLAWSGNILGRRAYIWAGGDKHYPNLFLCGVGPTSVGRKGSATSPILIFFSDIDRNWVLSVQSGLSSGEGLIWAVRDPVYRVEKISQGKGIPADYQEVLVDAGVNDKRLLIYQSEFQGVLQVMRRQGNTLSSLIRDAFDRGNLSSLTKNSPAKATDAHISIVANITRDELLRYLLSDEIDNGFANRFLWACSCRSKCLPEGGKMWQVIRSAEWRSLQDEFRTRLSVIEGEITRDAEAADLWGYDDRPEVGVYRQLTQERYGVYGAVTSRAAALTLRLSLIYALLDGSAEIRREHLLAALEVWRYCDESARYIFGDASGDPTADEIMAALQRAPEGMTRTDIQAMYARHRSASEIARALTALLRAGRVTYQRRQTDGRPVEVWHVVSRES